MRLDVQFQRLIAGEISVHLTRGELKLMEVLAHGKLATMDKLISTLWGCDGPEGQYQIVQLMVWRMRKKFTAAGLPAMFKNVWGKGYVLTRPIKVVTPEADPIVIPAEHRRDLERLLFSHPDHAAADRVLASFVGG